MSHSPASTGSNLLAAADDFAHRHGPDADAIGEPARVRDLVDGVDVDSALWRPVAGRSELVGEQVEAFGELELLERAGVGNRVVVGGDRIRGTESWASSSGFERPATFSATALTMAQASARELALEDIVEPDEKTISLAPTEREVDAERRPHPVAGTQANPVVALEAPQFVERRAYGSGVVEERAGHELVDSPAVSA